MDKTTNRGLLRHLPAWEREDIELEILESFDELFVLAKDLQCSLREFKSKLKRIGYGDPSTIV